MMDMASVQKHRGNWVAVWVDRRNHRHRKVRRTKKEALDYAVEQEALERDGIDTKASERTLGEFALDWIEIKIRLSKEGKLRKPRIGTLQGYRQQIRDYICHPKIGLGSVRLRDLTPPCIKAWRGDLVDRYLRRDENDPRRPRRAENGTLSTRSINAVVTLLSGILKDAIEDGYLASNPGQIRKLTEPSREIGFLGAKEISRFLHAAWDFDVSPWPTKAFATMVHLAVLCGLRRSELLALRWRHVDLEKQILSVLEGYGVHGFAPTKTVKSRRVIGFGGNMADLLRRHRARTQELDPNGLLFDAGGAKPIGKPYDPSNFSKRVSSLLRQEGFPANTTLHSLRHSYATVLLEQGADLFKVSTRLGHTTTQTTTGIYAHALPDSLQVEADLMENAVFGNQ